MLAAYTEGMRIVVRYFRQNNPEIDIRTVPADISQTDHAVHKDFTEIRNFEMKLQESLSREFAEEDRTETISGSAVTYCGFEPRLGDYFLYSIDNNQLCVFKVNGVTPTSYRQERQYLISFVITSVATPAMLQSILDSVEEVVYFDKRKYFTEGELTFLSSQGWQALQQARLLRKKITQDYINTFFNHDYDTFFRPDKVYDPYIVEYLKSKMDVFEFNVRPRQIYPRMDNYHRSIWYKFVDAMNTVELDDVCKYYKISTYETYMFDVDITALSENKFLTLVDDVDTGGTRCGTDSFYTHCHDVACRGNKAISLRNRYIKNSSKEIQSSGTYVFTEAFYRNTVDSMTQLDRVVWKMLTENCILVKDIFDIIERYRKITNRLEMFYRWPVYVALCDAAIRTVR